MKHLDTATTLAIVIIILLPSAGCSESTSRARNTRSVAAESAATVAATEPDDSAIASPSDVEPISTEEVVVVSAETSAAPSDEAAAPAEVAATTDLELRRLVMARGVENHEPVGSAESFVHDGTALFAFMQVANPSSEDQEIVIRYQHSSGQIVGPVQLNVPAGSRGWRTFTRTYWIRHPGVWTVSVETTDGQQLGQHEFTMNPS